MISSSSHVSEEMAFHSRQTLVKRNYFLRQVYGIILIQLLLCISIEVLFIRAENVRNYALLHWYLGFPLFSFGHGVIFVMRLLFPAPKSNILALSAILSFTIFIGFGLAFFSSPVDGYENIIILRSLVSATMVVLAFILMSLQSIFPISSLSGFFVISFSTILLEIVGWIIFNLRHPDSVTFPKIINCIFSTCGSIAIIGVMFLQTKVILRMEDESTLAAFLKTYYVINLPCIPLPIFVS